jgi:Cytochrome P450
MMMMVCKLVGSTMDAVVYVVTQPSSDKNFAIKQQLQSHPRSYEWTQIALHMFSIHRDAQYFHWHTPSAFLLERWFSKGAPAGEHNTAAIFPFSYGRTIRAGKNLALEMHMVLFMNGLGGGVGGE